MTKTIRIDGMSCKHCTSAVEKALGALAGVAGVNVDLAAGEARITTSAPVADKDITEAIADAGFEVIAIQ